MMKLETLKTRYFLFPWVLYLVSSVSVYLYCLYIFLLVFIALITHMEKYLFALYLPCKLCIFWFA